MAGLVDDKVVLVTGAGSGIGRATALAFARDGARAVVVADIDPDGGNETVELIRATGADAQFVACDVTDAAQVDAMVATTVGAYGRLDCAHNNAGISLAPGGFTAVRLDQWQRVVNVNLKSVWLCLRAEIRHMLARDGGGAIVNTASAAGIIGTPGNPAYAATKHGVLGLTKTAAVVWATVTVTIPFAIFARVTAALSREVISIVSSRFFVSTTIVSCRTVTPVQPRHRAPPRSGR